VANALEHASTGRTVVIAVDDVPWLVAYDSVASALAGYGDPAALAVAGKLDDEVLTLLRGAA
jgi:hypothetical protein